MGKIRLMAKYRLDGKWGILLIMFSITLLSALFTGDFSFIAETLSAGRLNAVYEGINVLKISGAVVGTVLFIIFVPTIKLGCERWFLLTAKGEKPPLSELFHYLNPKGTAKSIKAFMYSVFRRAAAMTLFLFPSVCLSGVLYFSFKEGEISLYISYALLGASLLLFALGQIFYFIYTTRYFAYYPIIVSNESISASDALEKSIEITGGAYRKICLFRLSFIPWLLLCLFIIPAFYVWGYYKESKAMLVIHNGRLHT